MNDSEEDLDEGRLAGAVRSKKAKDLSWADTQRDVVERLNAFFREDSGAVSLAEGVDFDVIHGADMIRKDGGNANIGLQR